MTTVAFFPFAPEARPLHAVADVAALAAEAAFELLERELGEAAWTRQLDGDAVSRIALVDAAGHAFAGARLERDAAGAFRLVLLANPAGGAA